MKIAAAAMGREVAHHFGHCESFILFDTQDGVITAEKTIPSPGHKPGFLPNFLGDLGVEVILAGGMGGGAVDVFNERHIEVVVGVEGDARKAAEEYLKGNLISTGAVCHEHEHKHAHESGCEK